MTIKTFNGLMEPDAIDTIVLHTNDGSTGYRIVSLDIMSKTPGVGDVDHVVQIFSVKQTAASATVDFSNQELLGVAFLRQDADASNITARYAQHIIFDNIIFNQDIYVTLKNARGNAVPCNYLIKLEQVKLDLNENTVATLKDIRNLS